MASTPAYAATPKCGIGQISTANTARDGTGTIGTVFTAGANGSRIDAIDLKATGTTTAGMVRLFIHNGTTAYLLTEVPVVAITPSATLPAWEALLNANSMSQVLPIILPTGYSLRAATNNAETFNVTAFGGDF
ncbi:hypothetical protein ACT80S_18555 [Ramlibacter sp. MAHUQ-53]|uniref:hypothetical protein n=1 Tax=unclassified Ramlibacter TaxID=2617605 RepID=UPI00362529B0